MDISLFLKQVKERFSDCGDFFFRQSENLSGNEFLIIYIGTLCDKKYVTESILKPLIVSEGEVDKNTIAARLAALPLTECENLEAGIEKVLAGNAVIAGGSGDLFFIRAIEAKSGDGRSVSEPDVEKVVRGPRQGFIENAEINVSLIRRIIKSTNLKVIERKCGDLTGTTIKILYYEGVARKDIVDAVVEKISSIKLTSCLDSGYLEHLLQNKRFNLFSEVGNSEKPDKIAAKILGGRVAIICDGSPVVLTVPYLFTESIQSAEDYLKNVYYASFVRILRFLGLLISIFLPAVYTAILGFHKGALPYSIYKAQAASRNDIPFDVFTELMIILIIFELIREVGVRMPKAVGSSLSIVGGLILGDAAIKAGIASETIIIIAALTSICNFMNPTYMNTNVLMRFINLILAKIFGFFGIAVSILFTLSALCSKKSFGVPYMSPFAPIKKNLVFDTIVSIPSKALENEQNEIKKYGKR